MLPDCCYESNILISKLKFLIIYSLNSLNIVYGWFGLLSESQGFHNISGMYILAILRSLLDFGTLLNLLFICLIFGFFITSHRTLHLLVFPRVFLWNCKEQELNFGKKKKTVHLTNNRLHCYFNFPCQPWYVCIDCFQTSAVILHNEFWWKK